MHSEVFVNRKSLDKQVIAIGLLSIMAVGLFIANFVSPAAHADSVVEGHDYQAVTARMATGGEGLYILDNRTGLLAVFTYDTWKHTLVPSAIQPAANCFTK